MWFTFGISRIYHKHDKKKVYIISALLYILYTDICLNKETESVKKKKSGFHCSVFAEQS